MIQHNKEYWFRKCSVSMVYISLVLFLAISINLFSIPALFAQEKKEKEYREIKKEELLEKLREVQEKEDVYVKDFSINGEDIIEIIKEHPEYEIKISNSIIRNGLDFSKLDKVPAEKIELPQGWKDKEEWVKLNKFTEYYVVKNRINIKSSEIQLVPPGVAKKSVEAGYTFFNSEAYFGGAIFSGEAIFFEATFNGEAAFPRTTFGGEASFDEATFSGGAFFARATFSGGASFSGATLISIAYFRETIFLQTLFIDYAVFKEYIDLRDARIRNLSYENSISPGSVNGRFDMRDALITEAHFQDITFERDADFSDAQFGIPFSVFPIVLSDQFEYPQSLKDKIYYDPLRRLLIFKGIMTEREKEELLNLSKKDEKYKKEYGEAIDKLFQDSERNSKIGPFSTLFKFVIFESDSYFIRTRFLGDTAFERITFKKEANFTDASFKGSRTGNQRFIFSYINFKDLLIKWDSLPDIEHWVNDKKGKIKSFVDKEEEKSQAEGLEPLSNVLKGLNSTFLKQGALSDANHAYYHMKVAELEEARMGNDLWLRIISKLEWIFWGLPSGYGVKLWRPVVLAILTNLFFALLYSVGGVLERKPHPKAKGEFAFKQRLFDLPKLFLARSELLEVKSESMRRFIDALRFSSVLIFKIGYRDTTISGKIWEIDYKHIVRIEWALGYYLLATLAITMSNTLPILNRLITGLF